MAAVPSDPKFLARVLVVASEGGASRHPAWFHDLQAKPSVTVEFGNKIFEAWAVVATGEERARLYRSGAERKIALLEGLQV